jgi:hypothetical protein
MNNDNFAFMKMLMLSVMTLFSIMTTEYALAGKRVMIAERYAREGDYEIGYINKSGQRFKNTKTQVLLNKKGEVIKPVKVSSCK